MASETTPLKKDARSKYITPSAMSSDPVELDPSADGTVMRYALVTEAAFNIIGATGMMLYPSEFLSLMVTNQSQVTAASASLMQWLGGLVYGLTVPLLLCLPNTRTAIESRPTVYHTLLAGEGVLIPLLMYQASASPSFGLTWKALFVCSLNMAGPCLWRLFVLFRRPELMGRYRDVRKDA